MFEKLRILISQIFIVVLLIVISISTSYWEEFIVSDVLFFIGVILVGIASLGRLWCSLYIAGYKTHRLITEGPYSLCRNPLYFFSLIGATGVGFASETFLIPLLIILAFAIYYPSVISSEEAELKKIHKNEFEMYFDSVPRFFPRISCLKEPEEYVVRPIVFRRHVFSAFWFICFVGILELIEALHRTNIITSRLTIY